MSSTVISLSKFCLLLALLLQDQTVCKHSSLFLEWNYQIRYQDPGTRWNLYSTQFINMSAPTSKRYSLEAICGIMLSENTSVSYQNLPKFLCYSSYHICQKEFTKLNQLGAQPKNMPRPFCLDVHWIFHAMDKLSRNSTVMIVSSTSNNNAIYALEACWFSMFCPLVDVHDDNAFDHTKLTHLI